MQDFGIKIIIWSFALYGFLSFWQELWLELVCYIVHGAHKMIQFLKKLVAKRLV